MVIIIKNSFTNSILILYLYYKMACSFILNLVVITFFTDDTDRDRRKLVKERTADYLCKAEFIANHFLSPESNSGSKKVCL